MLQYDHFIRSLAAFGAIKATSFYANKKADTSNSRLTAVNRSGALPIDTKEKARYSAAEKFAVATKCSATWANRAAWLSDKATWGVYFQQLAPLAGGVINYMVPGAGNALNLSTDTQNKFLIGSVVVGLFSGLTALCSSGLASRNYRLLSKAQSNDVPV